MEQNSPSHQDQGDPAKDAPKRGRGRPATGVTPAPQRAKKMRDKIKASGGNRVTVGLSKDANESLEYLLFASASEFKTNSEVISAALISYSESKKRKKKAD